MSISRYRLRPLLLRFADPAAEREYEAHILVRTLWYARVSWGLVALLGALFGLLDAQVFGDAAGTVLGLRAAVVGVAGLAVATTFVARLRPWLAWSAPTFIVVVGLFCTALTALGDRGSFTPYFTGLFYAFAGTFSTPGLGFRRSLWAMLGILAAFELAVGVLAPVSPQLLLVYSFFAPGIVLVFGYAAYLMERTTREHYVTAAQLRNSLADVKQLSGLLPICSSCKKIRDDQGQWTRIEVYVSARSEADFSHGLCPDCAATLYPELHPGGEPDGG